MSKKILITGASGQLGQTAVVYFARLGCQVLPYDIHDLDITNAHSVASTLDRHRPDILFNCAAYTAVDKAEEEPETAKVINCDAVETLATQCNKHNTLFVHMSTDYIFDGTNNTPYSETSQPNPINVYGESKLCGDQAIERVSNNWLILRTSWVYSVHGNNFLKTMLRLGQKAFLEETSLSIVNDQIGSPTSAQQIVEVAAKLISDGKRGLYNVSSQGQTSWYEFAQEIFKQASIAVNVYPCPSSNYPQKAKRPLYSVLSKNKLISEGYSIAKWEDALNIEIKKMNLELH